MAKQKRKVGYHYATRKDGTRYRVYGSSSRKRSTTRRKQTRRYYGGAGRGISSRTLKSQPISYTPKAVRIPMPLSNGQIMDPNDPRLKLPFQTVEANVGSKLASMYSMLPTTETAAKKSAAIASTAKSVLKAAETGVTLYDAAKHGVKFLKSLQGGGGWGKH